MQFGLKPLEVLPMKLLMPFITLMLVHGCNDSTVDKTRSVQCTMKFTDKCTATTSGGKTIWLKAFSSAETVVSYTNDEEECNKAAASHVHSGPQAFFFEGGDVMAKDALQSTGEYIFKGNDEVQFHYVKVGQANFQLGNESGTLTCTGETDGSPHSY